MTMYEKFCQLGLDGRWIGLEKSDMCVEYFCTPINATVIGCENSIYNAVPLESNGVYYLFRLVDRYIKSDGRTKEIIFIKCLRLQ